MILRRAIRDLRAMGARAVLVVLAIGLAAGAGSGASLTATNVRGALDSFYSDYHLADAEMTLTKLRPQSTLIAQARRAGAPRASPRLLIGGRINAATTKAAAVFVGMLPHTPLNQLQVLEGKGLEQLEPHGIVLEVDFAHTHHVSVGEAVQLEFGSTAIRAKVEGIGRTPESVFASVDPDYFVLQRGSLAYVYAPLEKIQETIAPFTPFANPANALLADLPADRGQAREQLMRGLPVNRLTPREQQFGYRVTQLNLSALSSLTPVLTAILASVAILLTTVTMMRLVQTQRRELGTMLAIGDARSAVVLTAVLPALILGLLGGLLAIAACVGVAKLMANEFTSGYGFLSVPTKLTFGAAALAMTLAFVTSLLSAVIPAVALSRLSPAEALRGDAPSSYRFPRWAQRSAGGGGTASSYGARNVLRTPLRSAFMVLGLAGAIGLGISLHIVATSVRTASDKWFSKQPWTTSVQLPESVPLDEARIIGEQAGARRVQPLLNGAAELKVGQRRLAIVNAVGAPQSPQLQSVGLPAGGLKPKTVYVSKQVAVEFDLEIGQRITLSGPAGEVNAVIAGTANTLAEETAYLPLEAAADLFEAEGQATALLVEGGAGTNTALEETGSGAKVVSKSTVQSGLDDLISQLRLLINTLVGIGLAVGTLFLISSLAMSVLERRAEFAVLRSLGWGMASIFIVIVTESLLLTTSGAIAGSLIAPAIASPLMENINSAWFQVDYDLRASNFLLVAVPALVLAVLVAVQVSWRISRLDIARAARARVSG